MGESIVTHCLANGQPEAAEFFVNLGAPLDLEGAAALEELGLVESYLDGANREEIETALLGLSTRPRCRCTVALE
jgi:hypothetical protein